VTSTGSRARWIVAIAAVVVAASSLLQWWQIGGGVGELSQRTGTGISDGRVFLMFLACVCALLLITLPFASEKPIAIDHPASYLTLLLIALVGFGLRVVSLVQDDVIPFPPQRGIGFWLAAAGLVLLARGVFELFEEYRSSRY
jgi:hypothetical protein